MVYPEPVNLTNVNLLVNYANTVTDGYFGLGILLAIYFTVFIYVKLRGEFASDSFLVAGWVTVIPAIIFLLMGIISDSQMFMVVALIIIPMAVSYFSKSPE